MPDDKYNHGKILTKREGDPDNNSPHNIEIELASGGKRTFSTFSDTLYGAVKRGQYIYFTYYETPPKEGSQRRTPYLNLKELLDGPVEGRESAPGTGGESFGTRGGDAQRTSGPSPQASSEHQETAWRTGLACKALEVAAQQSGYDAAPEVVTELADRYLTWLYSKSTGPRQPKHAPEGSQMDGERSSTAERSTTQPEGRQESRNQPQQRPDREYCRVEGHGGVELHQVAGQTRKGHPYEADGQRHMCYGGP